MNFKIQAKCFFNFKPSIYAEHEIFSICIYTASMYESTFGMMTFYYDVISKMKNIQEVKPNNFTIYIV